jgi:hypothetical protein
MNDANNNPSVTGVIYVAAFAPNEGQSLTNLVDSARLPNGFFIIDKGEFDYINPNLSHDSFAQDVDPAQAKITAAT